MKYGVTDAWVTKEANNPYGVTVWRSIRKWWTILKNHTVIKVHDGNKTAFWKDRWLGNRSFLEIFPYMFDLAQQHDRTAADMWSPQVWDFIFRRSLNDWEIRRLVELFKTLETFQGLKDGMDGLWWNGHSKGDYKVSSGYSILNMTFPQTTKWPWKQVWKARTPLKVACFSWLLAKEVVLTHENLGEKYHLSHTLLFK